MGLDLLHRALDVTRHLGRAFPIAPAVFVGFDELRFQLRYAQLQGLSSRHHGSRKQKARRTASSSAGLSVAIHAMICSVGFGNVLQNSLCAT